MSIAVEIYYFSIDRFCAVLFCALNSLQQQKLKQNKQYINRRTEMCHFQVYTFNNVNSLPIYGMEEKTKKLFKVSTFCGFRIKYRFISS